MSSIGSGVSLRNPLLFTLILFGTCNPTAASETEDPQGLSTPRIRYTLNENWRFLPDDLPGAEQPDCDDSAWEVVELPHTWNAEDPFDDEPGYRRGPSWYRRTLRLAPQLAGKRLFLHFEGAHQFVRVFVNGRPAGQHKGGYTAFTFEISELVEFNEAGAAAVVAVRVDNSHDTSIPPLAIGYAFYGGIYRDVWLIATDPVHFDLLDYGSPGIYVDTPDVSAQSGKVRVRGAVLNQSGEVRDLRVVTMVLDADNHPVARMETPLAVAAGGRAKFEQRSDPVDSPHLWSPDDPYLYQVCCAIEDSNGLRDAYKTGLGFRWFKFDSQKGFSLNGRRLFLRGASRHQDYQGLGSALPNWMHRSDLEWLKRMGGNFVRLAHYPQEQEVLEAADRLGLIVWEEIPIVTTMSTTAEFAQTARTNLTEMIRQHYNHPSVMMWGYMNEVLLGWKPKRPRADQKFPEKVVPLARELEELARREDPTRATVMAMHTSIHYDRAGISKVPMVAGWNIYFGWYGNVLSEFGNFLDGQHETFPDRPIIVSEYGAGSDARLHSLNPQRFDHTTEYMFAYHESYWQQIEARPWLAGSLIWNQFDFSQPTAGDSMPHVNQKGMLTWDRKPKDVYYFYQANWVSDPVLHIASREWSRRTGTCRDAAPGAGPQPVRQPVKVYSNLDEVELLVNGESLGTAKPDELCRLEWQVPFRDGWNTLEARGLRERCELRDTCRVHFKYYPPQLADSSVPFDEFAVNVGSTAQFIDESGLVWEAEQPYARGAWGYEGGQDRYSIIKVDRTSGNIFGTSQDPLYQLYREGIRSFRFDVPDGDYELDLRFTEYTLNQTRKRVFGVTFNGQPLIDKLDLFAEYGRRRAVARVFRVTVTSGRGATLGFEPIAGEPVLCGVRIRRVF